MKNLNYSTLSSLQSKLVVCKRRFVMLSQLLDALTKHVVTNKRIVWLQGVKRGMFELCVGGAVGYHTKGPSSGVVKGQFYRSCTRMHHHLSLFDRWKYRWPVTLSFFAFMKVGVAVFSQRQHGRWKSGQRTTICQACGFVLNVRNWPEQKEKPSCVILTLIVP